MSSINWGIIAATCGIASVLVVVLIIIINTQGRRGQALTWLPSSLATILALQYITDKSQLNILLEVKDFLLLIILKLSQRIVLIKIYSKM